MFQRGSGPFRRGGEPSIASPRLAASERALVECEQQENVRLKPERVTRE